MTEPTLTDLEIWDREILWHPFTPMASYEPFIIERARGCYLYDMQGRRYLDGVSSLWCNVHGHRHPRLDAALIGQIEKVAHCTQLGASNPTTIEFARRLVELAPDPLKHVFFSSDGAAAVEVALKMAFQYWHQRPDPRPAKTTYLAFTEAYHGDTLGSVSVGGVQRFHELFEPLLFATYRAPVPQMYRRPGRLDPAAATAHYAERLESILSAHHEEIVAIVIEPLVQCAAGMIVHPPGFLRGVRELATRYDVLLIADEVAVGFGRTGHMFACEKEAVAPDLLCLGKGITAGYLPLSATLATEEIYAAFSGDDDAPKTFFHGHTYAGNPLAAAVGLASLDIFAQEQTLAAVAGKIEQLTGRLDQIARLKHVGDVRQCGMIAGIELVRDRESAQPYEQRERRGAAVCRYARDCGVFLRSLGDVVVVMPPLAITDQQIDDLCTAVHDGIVAATECD